MITNKDQTAAMEVFLFGTANSALAASGAFVGATNALTIANGQLGVMCAEHDGTVAFGTFIPAGTDASDVDTVRILQGTPNSSQLTSVNPFGVNDKAYVQTGNIKARNVRSVSTFLPSLPSHSIQYINTVSGQDDGTRYTMQVQLEGVRTDLAFGMNRDLTTAVYDLPASGTVSNLLQNLALQLNRSSQIIGQQSPTHFAGNKPFVVLGVDTAAGSGTTIGTMNAGDVVNIATYVLPDGSTQTFSLTMTTSLINALHEAVGNVAALSTDTIVVMTAAATNAVTGLLVIGLDEDLNLAFDNIKERKTRVRTGIGGTLTYTISEVATPFEGRNLYRQASLKYEDKAALQIFNMQNQPIYGEYFIIPPSYFDADVDGYTVTIIDYYDENQTINGKSEHPKRAYILLPASITDETADVDTGYAWTTTNSTTVTSLNNTLGVWLSDADDVYNNISYKGSATKAAPFV